ncbi:hypothetical protein [Craterilacuibacter sinensis]|uniref:Bacterial toxin YdaT domain-containing protein n=1 Tax=Craterilacuibacter sinensis TaxID=2686017 RepID=A0A845BXM0_9NEIS|nr:hypothetical protein [Craterilacuibacter sinensis]MXR37243.1 hypothetical protein [Craterilacuibacter sinensis]
MKANPHQTWISVLRDHVGAWRQRKRWSNETVAAEIVESYYQLGFDAVWLVDFHRAGPCIDPVTVMKTNNQRLVRWLDDQSKDTSLLPANMVPLVLLALPLDLRLSAATEMLSRVGLSVGLRVMGNQAQAHAPLMTRLAREAGEGVAAFASLGEQLDVERLKSAELELEQAAAEIQHSLSFVRNQLVQVSPA